MLQFKLRKKLGFTLIELIIVIGIIAFLATAILTGYNSISQSYKFGLVADELQSQLSLQKSRVESQIEAVCFGVILNKEGIFFIKSAYKNPIQKCSPIPETPEQFGGKGLVINQIKIDGRLADSVTYYYVPPKAQLYFPFEQINENSIIEIEIGLKNTEKSKKFFLVPASGYFSDLNPSQSEN